MALYEPGAYTATLTYYNGTKTTAAWNVRPLAEARKARNVILFIGDGMTLVPPSTLRGFGRPSAETSY